MAGNLVSIMAAGAADSKFQTSETLPSFAVKSKRFSINRDNGDVQCPHCGIHMCGRPTVCGFCGSTIRKPRADKGQRHSKRYM